MAVSERKLVLFVVLGGLGGAAFVACGASHGGGGGTGGSAGSSGGAIGSGGTRNTDAGPGDDAAAASGGSGSPTGGVAGTGGVASTGGSGGMGSGGTGGEDTPGTGGGHVDGSGGTAGRAAGGMGGRKPEGTGGAAGQKGGAGGTAPAAGGASGASCAGSTLTVGNTNRTIQIGGVSRSYILHVPTGYAGTKAVPLVLDFHALGGTGSQEQSSSGYQAIADKQGFVILFPDGIDNAWNIGPCCTNSPDVDDLGFAKGMVAAMVAEGCIDTKRVYATGFSMGGGMSHYLACNAAEVFAAAAPSSFDLLVPDEEPCAPSRPISVLTYRGTADTTVPYAGGPGPSGRITFLGAQGSFQRWASIDGCTTATTTDGDCTYYSMCSAGVEVGLCVKQGGGHAPGDANVGWAFLSRFTLP